MDFSIEMGFIFLDNKSLPMSLSVLGIFNIMQNYLRIIGVKRSNTFHISCLYEVCTYILVPGSEFNNWNSSWKQLAGLMQSLMQSVPIDATRPLQPKEFWVSRQWRQFLAAVSSANNLPYYNQVGLRAAQDLTLWWSIPSFAGQQCIDEHDMKMCQMKCITICFELDYPWLPSLGIFWNAREKSTWICWPFWFHTVILLLQSTFHCSHDALLQYTSEIWIWTWSVSSSLEEAIVSVTSRGEYESIHNRIFKVLKILIVWEQQWGVLCRYMRTCVWWTV